MKQLVKTHLLVCTALFVLATTTFGADAPFAVGSMTLSGNVYYMSQTGELYENSDSDGLSTVTITPRFGYFIAPGLMLGATVDFIKVSVGDYAESILALGPQVGYYFGTNRDRTVISGAVYPYFTWFATIGSINYEYLSDNFTAKSVGLTGGVVVMMSNSVGLDIGLRYSSDSWRYNAADASGTTIQVGAGIASFIF